MILGIDPSTKCGFAILDRDGARVHSGVWNLQPRAGEGSGARFWRLHVELGQLLLEHPRITTVAYEVPGFMRTQAAAIACMGLASHVESWCEQKHLTYQGFAPTEVKRAAGLKGNADKPQMVAAANERWKPHQVKRDDEADALFVALALLKELHF